MRVLRVPRATGQAAADNELHAACEDFIHRLVALRALACLQDGPTAELDVRVPLPAWADAMRRRDRDELQELLERIASSATRVEQDDAIEFELADDADDALRALTGQDESRLNDCARSLARHLQVTPAYNLRRSALTLAWSAVEGLVGSVMHYDLVKNGFGEDVLGKQAAQEKRLSVAEVLAYDALEDFTREVARERAEQLVRGGLDKWDGYLKRRFRGQGCDDFCVWPSRLFEVAQRRNVMVHYNGRVSHGYREILGRKSMSSPPFGTLLELDAEYMDGALDELLVFGVLVGYEALCHWAAEDATLWRNDMNRVVIELLKSGRWDAALRLSKQCFGDPNVTSQSKAVFQVNLWLAQKGCGGVEAIVSSVGAWNIAGLHPQFVAVRPALLDDHRATYDALRKLLRDGDISPDQVRAWPLFESFRQSRQYQGLGQALDAWMPGGRRLTKVEQVEARVKAHPKSRRRRR